MKPPVKLDFLVIGAYKSGTTSVQAFLRQHPEIFVPRTKEPSFWAVPQDGRGTDRPIPAHAVRDPDEYASLFCEAPAGSLRGEVSPEYLPSDVAPPAVAAALPGVRLVAVLRDPIDRAWSDWVMYAREGRERLDFEAALEEQDRRAAMGDPTGFYLSTGMYATQLRRWLEHFPREQLAILFFDDLRSDPRKFSATLFRELGVSPHVSVDLRPRKQGGPPPSRFASLVLRARRRSGRLAELLPRRVRRAVLRRLAPTGRPTVAPRHVRQLLAPVFREEIEAVEEIAGRDLSEWKR
ncbi:MAG: sulfotransferase [Acidimicrobiales bacterium]|nr:MAG: sulfotransferase [Acidimicrobiales bacterium]